LAFAEKATPLTPGDFIGNWMRLMAPAAEKAGWTSFRTPNI
jgi:carbonic anhydrase